MRQIVLVAHNVRSCHNVGSLLRTAEGLGVREVILCGYTPYPPTKNDQRLPHEATRIGDKIAKTALGAEKTINWSYQPEISGVMTTLRAKRFNLVALEQSDQAKPLPKYKPLPKIALLVGNEVVGIGKEILAGCDEAIAIPMLGRKESFNVAVAAGIALYHLRFN